ncbi:alginate lyase family protein [Streptomyces sp. TP-A0356]|uniref:alginate lyase family protein n=1 Tax=Streptomyces sp. TP-A0356 TaxID=1359208 RepID=UPI0006E217BA|nr:alginate lyase family protein [Streptomyces sp. TP-A0356]
MPADGTGHHSAGTRRLVRLRRLAVSAAALPPGVLAAEAGWRIMRTGARRLEDGRERRAGARPPLPEPWRPFLLGGVGTRSKVEPSPLELEECLREADAALDGRFTVLGYGPVAVAPRERGWHQDPVHGFTWPARHHRCLAPVPGRADIKVPWEVSRLQWLTALARAHAHTGDTRYRDGAVDLLRSWAEANPVGSGPNWTNAMEAGIRAANLVWSAEILDDPELTALAGGMLRGHGWFILANLEYTPRLTSNHYLADLVGLVHAGGALRHSTAGRLWLRTGSRQLQREVLKQFHEDGSNFEASTGYHRLSTELALLGLLALRRLGIPVRPEVRERVLSAAGVLSALTKPDGLIPALGDDDSGLVVGLQSGRDPRDPSPVLAAATVMSDSGPSREVAEPAPELAQWCGARAGGVDARTRATSFPGAGWYVLADGPYWCLTECGGVGQHGNGGHGHNDTLSFVLCVDGREIVTDPGTGVYTPDPDLRNLLRATRSHSTVEVDGEEQNHIDPELLFTLRNDDHARVVHHHRDSGGRQVVEAVHEGYRRLGDPVVHRRRFTLDRHGLTVSDDIDCGAGHTLVVSLPLAPGVCAEPRGGHTLLFADDAVVRLEQTAGPQLSFRVEEMPWSPAYGRVVTTHVLRATLRVEGPVTWSVRFCLADGAQG